MLLKRTAGAPLSEAEVKQRRDAARARWEGAAAGAAGGAIGAAGLAAGVGWYRNTTAASELAAGKIRAGRFRQAGERQVQAYAERAREIDGKLSRPWPLRTYAQHLRRKTARLDREWEEFNAGRGPLPKPRDTYQGLKDRFMRRREQLLMETHAASTVVPPKGKAYVAGAKGTKVPQRLQTSAAERLMEGWIDPEARGKRTPLLWPTQPDIDQMRRELRDEIPKRQSWFTTRARQRAERQAGQAAAAGFGAARATLRRWPKVTGGRIAALGTLGALAGGAAVWAARKPVEKLAKGAVVHSGRELDAVAAVARPPRSLAEAEAGNYRKAHVRLHGLEIAIETPRGADRIGWAKDGRVKWRCAMPAHYGYVKGTEGHDGDAIDVYMLPGALDAARPVYVVDQVRLPSGDFDEHKVVLGAASEAEATRIYDRGFSDGSGPKRRRAVTRMTLAEFKAWLPAVDGPLAKAAPTDPTDPTDDGAFDRPEPSDDENSSSSSSAPGPTQDRISRALGRLFDRWLRDPRTIGDQKRVEDALKPMQDAFKAGAEAAGAPPGGVTPASETAGGPGRGNTLQVAFDARNPLVERHLREYSLGLIREIADSSRQAIRNALTVASISGAPVEQQARWIRESIGLTDAQAAWVRSFRAQVETRDPRALNRALRDKRYDRTLRRSIETGEAIPPEKIDAMVAAYHRRTLAYRATTIARTEAIRAPNLGGVAGMRSILDSNADMTVEKIWIATKDDRTRDAHRELDGRVVEGMDAFFTARNADGREVQIRWPHDELAPAEQTVNCRCTLGWRLKPRQAVRMVAQAV